MPGGLQAQKAQAWKDLELGISLYVSPDVRRQRYKRAIDEAIDEHNAALLAAQALRNWDTHTLSALGSMNDATTSTPKDADHRFLVASGVVSVSLPVARSWLTMRPRLISLIVQRF